MNEPQLKTKIQYQAKKVGRKVRFTIENLSSEERLDSLANLIIERVLEERNKAPVV